MAVALILFVASVMMIRLAFATIAEAYSELIIAFGVLLMLAALFVFGRYFRE